MSLSVRGRHTESQHTISRHITGARRPSPTTGLSQMTGVPSQGHSVPRLVGPNGGCAIARQTLDAFSADDSAIFVSSECEGTPPGDPPTTGAVRGLLAGASRGLSMPWSRPVPAAGRGLHATGRRTA